MIKTLKFSSELIPLIESGNKTKTWRLNDDKQLEVGDQLQFIDSSTGAVFGYGQIEQVVSKRVKDLDKNDQEGHETYQNNEEMLAEFRKYYGPNVTEDSIVKVVKYAFSKYKKSNNDVSNTTQKTEVKLFTDGGSRGNPGPSATGIVLMDMDDNVVTSAGKYLGITTNNQAEYQAVLQGLEIAKNYGARTIHVYMDSLLVVNQMVGIFKIKNRELWPIHQAIKDLIATFEKVNFVHVPREMNRLADAEVNKMLDSHAKSGIESDLL